MVAFDNTILSLLIFPDAELRQGSDLRRLGLLVEAVNDHVVFLPQIDQQGNEKRSRDPGKGIWLPGGAHACTGHPAARTARSTADQLSQVWGTHPRQGSQLGRCLNGRM